GCGGKGHLPWGWARERAWALGQELTPDPRELPLDQVTGGVLGADVRALAGLPAFDAAAMDGFAVSGQGPWRLGGRRMAGAAEAGPGFGGGWGSGGRPGGLGRGSGVWRGGGGRLRRFRGGPLGGGGAADGRGRGGSGWRVGFRGGRGDRHGGAGAEEHRVRPSLRAGPYHRRCGGR